MEEKKVISIEDRIPKLKEARKKKANRRLIYYLTMFTILISLIIYLQSPLSDVKTIEVDGNKYVDKETILTIAHVEEKMNIWEVSKKKVTKRLKENALIDEATIERKLPNTIKISVKENPVVGFVQTDGGYSSVLPNGTLVPQKEQQIDLAEAPVLKKFEDDDMLSRMADELALLSPNIVQLISEVIWTPSDENQFKIVLYMNDGLIVDTSIRSFAEKMEDYPTIVAQIEPGEKGIIHMGVGTYFESVK